MKRRFLAVAMVLAMTAAAVMGCSSSGGNTADTQQNQESAEPAQAEENAAESSDAQQTEDTQQADSGEKVKIAAIYRDMTQSWFIQEAAAAENQASALGMEPLIVGDSKEDPSVYVDVLDNVLSQDIQGLIVNICDQQLSQMTVTKCQEAGIPVVAVDVPLIDENGSYLAPAIELDSYLSGRTMGEWAVNYINENNMLENPESTGIMILAMEKVTSCVPRSDGQIDVFKESFPDFPEGNIIRIDYGGGSSDEGYNAAAATITAHPEITSWIVTAANDEGAQGATRALEQAGLDKDSVTVGLGGYHAKDEFRKEYSCFKAAAYIKASTVGEESVKALYENIVNGTPIFEEYKTDKAYGVYPFGAVMVTAENFEEVMGEDAK
ncbi:MAG: substrate-binding domain-containing protein [Lachnospiraceae bacterium]|nr:substrate-binding domain-containing protein [Lachnospiraceae bacterium]GFI04834.1 L-arabinose-binding periplasmic protein [Lachnospiraceae bacterium]